MIPIFHVSCYKTDFELQLSEVKNTVILIGTREFWVYRMTAEILTLKYYLVFRLWSSELWHPGHPKYKAEVLTTHFQLSVVSCSLLGYQCCGQNLEAGCSLFSAIDAGSVFLENWSPSTRLHDVTQYCSWTVSASASYLGCHGLKLLYRDGYPDIFTFLLSLQANEKIVL